MTREQIGTALEYSDPRIAITKIHTRNADRLDLLSTSTKLVTVEEERTVEREMFVYNLRGVMEICRFSRQPKADKFMDFVWDVMESLYNGNSVLSAPDQQTAVSTDTFKSRIQSIRREQGHSIIAVNRTPRNYHCSELFNSNHTGTQAVRTQKYIVSSQ